MEDNMKYFVTGWCGIPMEYLTKEQILTAKECGLDVLPGGYGNRTREALDLFWECGMQMSLIDGRIGECMRDPGKIDVLIPELCAEFGSHPALHDYHVTDEPGCAAFPVLAKIAAKLKECDPDHPAYINLFPDYANCEQLGCSSYDEHVQRYLEEVKPEILSYDHYHFLTKTPNTQLIEFSNPRDAAIYYDAQKRDSDETERRGFFNNFEVIRREGLKADIPYMLIVLLTEHGPYRYLSRGEILWEVSQSFAYGVSAMSYFTYWTPDFEPVWHFQNGIITADGKKNAHWDDAREINRVTKSIGEIIASTRSAEVFHVGEEPENVRFFPEDGFGGIRSIEGGRFTVGFFENGMIFAANKDFRGPAELKIVSESTLKRFDPVSETWCDAGESVSLEAGEGVLLRKKAE